MEECLPYYKDLFEQVKASAHPHLTSVVAARPRSSAGRAAIICGAPTAEHFGQRTGMSRTTRTGGKRYEHRIHAHSETRPGGLHDHRPAVRCVFPAQLFCPHRGGRGWGVFVHATFQSVQQTSGHRLVGHLHPVVGAGHRHRADRTLGVSWRSFRFPAWSSSVAEWVKTTDLSALGDKVLHVVNDLLARVPFLHITLTAEMLRKAMITGATARRPMAPAVSAGRRRRHRRRRHASHHLSVRVCRTAGEPREGADVDRPAQPARRRGHRFVPAEDGRHGARHRERPVRHRALPRGRRRRVDLRRRDFTTASSFSRFC